MAHSLATRTNIFSRNVPRSIRSQIHAYGPTTVFYKKQSQSQSLSQSQCRSFSQTHSSRAKGRMMSAQSVMPKMPPEMSIKSRMRNMSPEDMPTDFGVLPGTFIRPEGKDMPSFFKQPNDRIKMEWVWLKSWVQNVLGTIYYHKWSNKGLPLELRQRRQIGKDLHHLMYTEFARGNERLLRSKCAPGLAQNLIRSIRKRSPNELTSWTLEKYNRTPSTFFQGVRVLSDRATQIPDFPDSGIRQVILRICSQQRTQKMSTNPNPALSRVGTIPKIQDCTEYVVIQKVRLSGIQKDWEIWGYTKPTTLEDLESPFFATGMSFKERVQAMQDMFTGKQ